MIFCSHHQMDFSSLRDFRGVVDEESPVGVDVADVGAKERVADLPILPDVAVGGLDGEDGTRQGHVGGEGASVDLTLEDRRTIILVLYNDIHTCVNVVCAV